MTRHALALTLLLLSPALAQEGEAPVSEAEAPVSEAEAPAIEGEEEVPSFVHDDDETPALERWGRGLLEVQDVYLLALNRLSPWARSPEILDHLEVEVGLKGVWSNSYAFARNRLIVDGEIRQLITTVRMGFFDRIELGIWLPYEWRGGGTLDGWIEDFHTGFGLPDADRDETSHDKYEARGTQKNNSAFNYDHKGYGFNDLITEARVLLYEGDELLPAATAVMRLRFPTGRAKFDLSDGVDISLGIDASQRLGDWPVVLYSGLAYTYYAKGKVDDLDLMRHRAFFYLGAELEFLKYFSLTVHGWIESPRETKLWDDASNLPPLAPKAALDFGNYVTYIAAGFKFEPADGVVFEIGILENIIDPETTADFTMMLNGSVRF